MNSPKTCSNRIRPNAAFNRDAGFARNSLRVIRWQATLDWLIARKRTGEQKSALQDLLRLAFTRFSGSTGFRHAAVHETVELAKRDGLRASRFCERLLRAIARSQRNKKTLAELKTTQPAIGWSHPEWLVSRWQKRWGAERTMQLLE